MISVIVPIYNVEKFLEKCVNSILNQTYKDLEIILVDDGSSDNSGKICDSFISKDNRIKVIHKINGGLSDARNCGIENATGEFLSFIDSDDWIEKDTYEILMKEYEKTKFDIVCIGMSIDYDNGKSVVKCPKQKEIFNSKQAVIYLNSYKNIDISACTKLYKREIFENIRFPYGKFCEDYYVMYKVFFEAKKICVLPIAKYHYFQRIGSISRNKNVNMDYLYASKEQMEYLDKNYNDISFVGKTNYAFANIALYNMKLKRNVLDDKKEIVNETKKLRLEVLKNRYLPLKKKLQFIIFTEMNWIYYNLLKIKM